MTTATLPSPSGGGKSRRVVILGGGHAGVRCAQELLRRRRPADNLDVALVSRENSEVWHGLMPQILSGVLQPQHVLVPLREFLPGVRVYTYDIEEIDLNSRRVTLMRGDEGKQIVLEYDELVLALGSVTDLSRFRGLQEHGLQTKSIGDFVYLRNHLIDMLETAAVETDVEERRRLLTFFIAGAGFAGIEIASEANEFIRSALRFYPSINPAEVRVIEVDIVTRILPAFEQRMADRAMERMRKRGIDLRLGVGLSDATAGSVTLSNGERIPTRSIIVTVGVGTNPLLSTLPLTLVRGRVQCDEFCRVHGWPTVYAVGDNAAVPSPSGNPYPAMLLVAFAEGRQVARNILAQVRGEPLRPVQFKGFGEVALLSRGYGLAQVRGMRLHGWPAAVLSRGLFLTYMPTWQRRMALVLHWWSSAIFRRDISQLRMGRSDAIVPMRFNAGETIVRQGEIASRFYIITSGEVEVVQDVDGTEQRLRRLGPGRHFGELALLQNLKRTASVRALSDTTVLALARQDFSSLVGNMPELQEAVQRGPGGGLGPASGA
ncbi:MAG: cyclic nucleotide-binding domain-containing protein [Chloroflexi bacterium]|nr:MAG: cyclic nucleotide-binding domain-containing protein [Chloroflexota bacterium]